MIFKCDYYLSVGYHLDVYAIWAHSSGRKVIAMKYGEMKDYTGIITIPYQLGTIQICPDLLQDHSHCGSCSGTGSGSGNGSGRSEESKCLIYGSHVAQNVPIIENDGLIKIFDSLLK
jgi:hypothetical protein